MVVFVTWVNDVMVLGLPSWVEQVQRDLEKSFTCKREGDLMEYVGRSLHLVEMTMERELSSSRNLPHQEDQQQIQDVQQPSIQDACGCWSGTHER
jgi:hypothetical protein